MHTIQPKISKDNTKEKVKGNYNLISREEEQMVAFLRDNFLNHANSISAKVHPRTSFYSRWGKRILDIVISLPICLVLLPLNLIFAVCTYFDVGRPLLYKQTRIGMNGKGFTMIKFRNMNNNTDADGRLLPAAERITKFGHFMRKSSLDELLNFWNVLKGDMSLIGPRPYPAFFHERMSDRHRMRECVRPGLECPTMYVPEGENLCNYHRKFENDIWYVENMSFNTDIKMCFALVKMVFDNKVRGFHAGGQAAYYFVGYDEDGHAMDSYHAKEKYGKEIFENSSIC